MVFTNSCKIIMLPFCYSLLYYIVKLDKQVIHGRKLKKINIDVFLIASLAYGS